MPGHHPPTVLILASGRGRRFIASGGTGSKLQALLHGKTVLQHTVDAVRASGLPFHVENGPHLGMGDSIAAAVRATRDAAGWLILPGDLPLIQPDTLRAMAQALADHAAVFPTFEGQRGHPVGFSAQCRAGLESLKGNQGAAPVLSAFHAMEFVVTDAGAVTDIDTLDDLNRVAQLLP
ncbi:nucleotidyltransferase family protein [Rhodoferax sp. AJA081-3]|uniref:nucleotidyltransferase family protein n=1 Tax=Rhodoferax sp. AJA081-3 TaxID=2752316 RepID=UPI001ADF45F3|nr:nucleotidyltransferase family protein [Rhodoferax sp. AJA081-3]QTN28995.1 nucleotidyltransferase family protein [Rhodoferax sp. AJA081-3]